jgi:hypothetical protein
LPEGVYLKAAQRWPRSRNGRHSTYWSQTTDSAIKSP